MNDQRWALALILAFYAISASLYIINVPIFEASDEAEHFIHIHTILGTGDLPIIQSRDEMARQADPILRWNNQSHHAPLYYMSASLLISWSERADLAQYLQPNELIFLRDIVEDNANKWLHRYDVPTSDTHQAVYLLRVVNLLIGMGTLMLVYRTAQCLSDHDWLATWATLLTASIPTFLVVNTSVTNDALVIFLYSAGLCWLAQVWRAKRLSWHDTLVISVIMAGIALTKLTGVTLFGVVYLGVLIGWWRGHWGRVETLRVIVISGLSVLVLAGWWYARNWSLYGDPLAVDATASIWGRETAFTLAIFPEELVRIGKTFWMMVGYLHYPVYAPDEFYIYTAIITVLGIIGMVRAFRSSNVPYLLGLMLVACAGVLAMLLYGTLSVDISYGRLLLPAIAGFAPLLVLGWLYIARLLAPLLIIPLSVAGVLIPLTVIPSAYPRLQAVTAPPVDATLIDWQADTLTIVAIDTPDTRARTGDRLPVDLYFRGYHPSNPALTMTAVDTIQVQRFDHIEVYPGMADTSTLPPDQLYRVRLWLTITQPQIALPPRQVNILVQWVDVGENEALSFDRGTDLLEVVGATYADGRYRAPDLGVDVNVSFGEQIILRDYALPERIQAGEPLTLSLVWDATSELARIPDEAILTLQVFDAEGQLVTQDDGALWWYPTTRWLAGVPFEDVRTIPLPDDLPPGDYDLAIGWYRVQDDQYPRLPISNSDAQQDDLYRIPFMIEEMR
ncbi:MAG: ArnT family glycosyltransferase [Anaerolineae bacterium]